MNFSDPVAAAPALLQRIARANRILILTHINPDGDAIGSLLGVYHAMQALGKNALPLASSNIPGYAAWLPGIEAVQTYQSGMTLPQADLVIMVDTATIPRVGLVYEQHADELAHLPLIIIDHHVTNDGLGTLNLITPAAASTCELLYQLFQAMQVPISAEIATCLLLGVTTDTLSFQTTSTRAETLHIAGDLLGAGADHQRVVQEVYYALPASNAALLGLALNQLQFDGSVAWTTVTQAMMQSTNAEDEANEEVIRVLQRITDARALVLFKERRDGTTKISLRSTPPINVAVLAQRWGGGGHAQAAGATLLMSPTSAQAEVLPQLRELVNQASLH